MSSVLTTAECPLCLAEAWGSCLGSRVAIVVCEKDGTERERNRRRKDDTKMKKKGRMKKAEGKTNGGEQAHGR